MHQLMHKLALTGLLTVILLCRAWYYSLWLADLDSAPRPDEAPPEMGSCLDAWMPIGFGLTSLLADARPYTGLAR